MYVCYILKYYLYLLLFIIYYYICNTLEIRIFVNVISMCFLFFISDDNSYKKTTTTTKRREYLSARSMPTRSDAAARVALLCFAYFHLVPISSYFSHSREGAKESEMIN